MEIKLYARNQSIIQVLFLTSTNQKKSSEFKLAMQHLIMLVHIQMQQMVHELAPSICMLKF